LEAATGVSAELFAMRGYATGFADIALVSGAIIYDYGPRKNAIYPDKQLGRAAMQAAQTGVFPIGKHGAGCSASVGKGFDFAQGEPAGQGGAFRQLGVTKVAAFTVVNALGAIVNREGKVVRGLFDPSTGTRRHSIEGIEQKVANSEKPNAEPGNTTLTVIVTNQRLDTRSLNQLAKQTHSSMARAIQPFHTLYDGDVLYAVTTNEVENPHLDTMALGIIASEVLWDAVLTITNT
jgi:L-aminopeptidase/D-esterase-like protein